MGGLIAYSGITTKIKAMKVRLMENSDYEKIVNLDSVAEFISFLKQHPDYIKILEHVDEQHIHRGQIEYIIVNSLYEEFKKVYMFSNMNQKKILSFFFLRFEVKVLKDCILRVHHPDDEWDDFLFMDLIRRHTDLPIDKIKNLSNMEELVQNLKGTKFYNTVFVVFNKQGTTLFDYETQLDIFYFKTLWKLKDDVLRGVELKAFTDVIGHQIDLINILWIYRFKLSYVVDTTKIYASIIPIHYKLTKKQISDMVESANVEDFLAQLKMNQYRKYYISDDTTEFEVLYRRSMREFYRRNSKKYPNSISPIHEFLYLKEREIDKLTTALECIRYQMSPEESLVILKD